MRVYILCKENKTKVLNVNPRKEYFEFRKGFYPILKDAVQKTREGEPELVYVENCPLPINFDPMSASDASEFLQSMLKQRALQDVKDQIPNEWLETLLDYLRNPSKILMLGIVIFILIALALAFITSGGKVGV
jgi:hypothetical protein